MHFLNDEILYTLYDTVLLIIDKLKAKYKTYAITGNDAYSFEDIAGFLTDITGKKVIYLKPDLDTYAEALGKAGVPKEVVGFLSAFATAIKNGEFDTHRSDLENLLGRKPMELKEFLKITYGR